MSFSERMKESLGVDGARIEVSPPQGSVSPGAATSARIKIVGGRQEAKVDAVIMRVVEARRHWFNSEGQQVSEEAAQALPDRRALMPAWSRKVVHERRVDVDHLVDRDQSHEIEVEVELPDSCGATTPSCVVTLNAQADIKGQIDPTGTATLTVA